MNATPVQLQILKARYPSIGEPTLRRNAAALLQEPEWDKGLLKNASTVIVAGKPKEPRRIALEPAPPTKTPPRASNGLESQGNRQCGAPKGSITLTLPYPPSTNAAWRSIVIKGQSRVLLSREGRAFKKAVATIATAARIQPFAGPIGYRLHIYRPQKRGDLSNRIKTLEDALQGYAYENDDQITHLQAWRHEDKANPRAEITIFPL